MIMLKNMQAVIKGHLYRNKIKKANSKSLINRDKNIPFVKGTLTSNQVRNKFEIIGKRVK